MPNPADKAEKAEKDALPDPELNPLLNPLLAAHMGRWAEVYFTTPAERREQAVADLLRELEATSPAQPDSQIPDEGGTALQPERQTEPEIETEKSRGPDSPPSVEESPFVCGLCAHENRQGQRFCGMCGTPLQGSYEQPTTDFDPHERSEPTSWAKPSELSSLAGVFDDSNFGDANYRITPADQQPDPTEPDWTAPIWPSVKNDIDPVAKSGPISMANSVADMANSVANDDRHITNEVPHHRDDVPHFAVASEAVPYRYRLYVGVGLAILLAVLIYMARRGTEALSGSPPARVIPAAQSGATNESPVTAPSAAPAENRIRKEKPSSHPRQSAKLRDATPPKPRAGLRPALRTTPAAPAAPVASSSQGGAEELITAQQYLNGNQGKTRNTQEAAQWLWKAVAKGNSGATLVLSDLYLHGDGVPKSCDQARLLLDAASRKGVKGAADRLRNLQAFGCQ